MGCDSRWIGIPGSNGPTRRRTPSCARCAGIHRRLDAGRSQAVANADLQRGQTAAQICVACHGKDGVGIAPTYPNLTHQSASAIYKQLKGYKAGARTGGLAAVVMAPMVTASTISRWPMSPPTTLPCAPRVTDYGADAVPKEIVRLVKIGSPARALPPCDSCHGVTSRRFEESPVLLGQSAAYFEQQLSAFAAGERRNDTYGRMRISRASSLRRK